MTDKRPKRAATPKKKRRAAGEGGLFKRADGMWCGVVDVPTADGRRRQQRVYSKDYGKAVDKLRELKKNVDDGIVISTSTTVGAWLDYWVNTIHKPTVRPKTWEYYEQSVRLHITPAIGKKRLDKLTPQQIREMLDGLSTSRNRQRAYQTLNLALAAAIKEGVLSRNVCDAVSKPGHLATTRGSFTFDQAQTIIRTAIKVEESRGAGTPALATRWTAAFLAGARQSEVIGLEWDRVDLDAGVFDFGWQLQQMSKVHGCKPDKSCGRQRPSWCPQAHWDFNDSFEYRECYRSLVFTRPKTKTGVRIVPIVPGLLEMLRHHRETVEPNPHGLVWHYPDGRPLSPTDDHEFWQELLVSAGITEKGKTIPMHSARHTTATMLQEAGVPEEVRMKIMGQSSVAAHREYIHVDQKQTRAALGNLAGLLA